LYLNPKLETATTTNAPNQYPVPTQNAQRIRQEYHHISAALSGTQLSYRLGAGLRYTNNGRAQYYLATPLGHRNASLKR